jgi:plastocyanin
VFLASTAANGGRSAWTVSPADKCRHAIGNPFDSTSPRKEKHIMRVRCTFLVLGVASLGLMLLTPPTTEAQRMRSRGFVAPMRVPTSRFFVAPRAAFSPRGVFPNRFDHFPNRFDHFRNRFDHFPNRFDHFPWWSFGGPYFNGGYSPFPYTTGYGGNPMTYSAGYGSNSMPYTTGYGGGQTPSSADYGLSQTPYSADYGSESYGASARNQTSVTVTLYDDSFQPGQITVPAGTTVRWVNVGQHRHTVTSDTGLWDSRELDSGEGYAHTFTVAGTYPYHCRFHAREMGGVVVVK